MVKVNPKKANPDVLGRDALSVVNAQSLTSSSRRRVDARLAEVRLQHIRQEEELKLKALAAAQKLKKLGLKQIVLQVKKICVAGTTLMMRSSLLSIPFAVVTPF